MITDTRIISKIQIGELSDLANLKQICDTLEIKTNKSAIARELECDRRTVHKYMNGYKKKQSRNRRSKYDDYYEIIKELLNNENKIFYYKKNLFNYLTDNYGLQGAESSFRRYLSCKDEFNNYFRKTRPTNVNKPTLRFENDLGEQAQLDWKESMEILLNTGEIVTVNICVLLLSYSRFRVYQLTLSKTQDILFDCMMKSFEIFDGIPKTILTDNMKTVMDISKSGHNKGKVNNKFQQFADDCGFKVQPCIAARPQTKAKVEAPMKILDELKAYNGDLSFIELVKKLEVINNRENNKLHKGYGKIPVLALQKEKNSLLSLPNRKIRNYYLIDTLEVKVNNSSMINYKSNQYSVPPKYINRKLKIQIYDNQIRVYDNTKLITIHDISEKKLNYQDTHYIQIAKQTLPYKEEKIESIAKKNLKMIGASFNNDNNT